MQSALSWHHATGRDVPCLSFIYCVRSLEESIAQGQSSPRIDYQDLRYLGVLVPDGKNHVQVPTNDEAAQHTGHQPIEERQPAPDDVVSDGKK